MNNNFECELGVHRYSEAEAKRHQFKCPADGTPIARDPHSEDDDKSGKDSGDSKA